MKKILIMGVSGMLGSMVKHYFDQQTNEYEVHGTLRNPGTVTADMDSFQPFPFNVVYDLRENLIPFKALLAYEKFDYVINCIGTIKPHMAKNPADSIITNSVFPHRLADACAGVNTKLIHITTDCVFTGSFGSYNESSPHDATDDYGKSKSLGEPDNCMVIRTSIIGPEVNHKVSLIESVKKQAGKTMNGYTHHHWNGITTLEFAKVCDTIMSRNMWKPEKRHVFSETVNKFELVNLINTRYKLGIKVVPFSDNNSVDRTLNTCYPEFLAALDIPSLEKQLNELPY